MPIPGPFELIIILVIVLVFFGTGKLGEVGGAMGRGIREFRKASTGDYDDKDEKPAEAKADAGAAKAEPEQTKTSDAA